MSKRKKIEGETLTGGRKITPPNPEKVTGYRHKSFNPKPKPKNMLQRIIGSRVGKIIVSILGSLGGFGGSLGAGIEVEFAVLVAATMFVAIFMGVEQARKFYGIFEDEEGNDSQRDH